MSENISNLLFNNGVENFKKKNFVEAQKNFEKFLSIHPEDIQCLENLVLSYFHDKKFLKAENCLKKIISLGKKDKKILEFLITVLKLQDKIDEIKKLIEIEKDNIDPKYDLIKDIIFPKIPKDNSEIKNLRESTLTKVIERNYNKNLKLDLENQLLDPPIYDFSYDKSDNLRLNGEFVKLFKSIYPPLNQKIILKKNDTSKIKIAFISQFLTDHTIGKLFKGLILKLDQDKFDISIFHLHSTERGNILDEFQKFEKKTNLKNFFLPKNFNAKVDLIKSRQLDIIFYPDIGISSELYFLTFLKLAKNQITSWGHPESSSNPNIDFFLSSDLLETKNCQDRYSEKLILSKFLPMYFYEPKQEAINENELNKQNVYSCPQTLFKIHPDFDSIINKILKRDKKAVIYFIKDKNEIYFTKLIERFKKVFSSDIDRVEFINPLSNYEYINHCGRASVLLDPLYFGACNSFHESMFYGTPTVSLPTDYLKSRIVFGAYKQMKINDIPVVSSEEDYVSLAIDLANQKPKEILEKKKYYKESAKKYLYTNENFIVEIENIFFSLINK